MPKYTILLFGPASTAARHPEIVIDMPELCTSDALKAQLAQDHPLIEGHIKVGRLAVNQVFVDGDAMIDPDAEIALITMVSGG